MNLELRAGKWDCRLSFAELTGELGPVRVAGDGDVWSKGIFSETEVTGCVTASFSAGARKDVTCSWSGSVSIAEFMVVGASFVEAGARGSEVLLLTRSLNASFRSESVASCSSAIMSMNLEIKFAFSLNFLS